MFRFDLSHLSLRGNSKRPTYNSWVTYLLSVKDKFNVCVRLDLICLRQICARFYLTLHYQLIRLKRTRFSLISLDLND